jgi:hypothetical protein
MSHIVIYIIRVILAVSVLINVLLGGKSNQTFSARNWEWKKSGKWHIVPLIDGLCVGLAWITIKVLTWMGYHVIIEDHKQHCMTSWIWWYTHAQKHDCEDVIERMEITNAEKQGREVQRLHFSGKTSQR